MDEIFLDYDDTDSLDNITDTSQFPFLNTIWIVRPLWEVILKTLLFLPIIIGGIVGNVTLLMIVAKYSRLRTPTNLLIASMAGIDLVNLILCPWMLLIHHFYQNYMLGVVGCKAEGFLSAAFLISGVMLLSSVSYDRLTAIVLPREKRLTTRGAIRLSVLSVVLGFAFASPLSVFRYYKERQWKNFLEKFCTENIEFLPIYWHVLQSTLVWIPITIMTICYSAIFCKLDRYQKRILRQEHPMAVNYKTRVARTLFIILLTFIVCHLPFSVLVFWRNEKIKRAQFDSIGNSFQLLWFIAHYLMYLNCAINPIIYGLTNENYRRAFGTTPLYKWLSGSKHTKNKNEESIQKPKRFSCCCKKNSDIYVPNVPTISVIEQNKSDVPEFIGSQPNPETDQSIKM